MNLELIISVIFLVKILKVNLLNIWDTMRPFVDLDINLEMLAIGWHALIIWQGKLIWKIYVWLSSYATIPIDFNFRNTDKKRRERVALNRAMGKRPEPRKQIKVVSTSKEWLIHFHLSRIPNSTSRESLWIEVNTLRQKRKQHSAAARMQAPAAGATIPLPRLGQFKFSIIFISYTL